MIRLKRTISSCVTSACALLLLSVSAHAVVFQAEDYNAFYDTTPGNTGGAYRGDDVDIEAAAGGGYNVGWIEATEWLAYNSVNFPTSGSYTIRLQVASLNGGGSASIDLNGGSIVLGTVNIPSTGGWQNWQTVSINATVNAGTYNLGVYALAGGWNFNWIEIVPNGGGGGGGNGGATWSDEFDSINQSNWTFETGGGGWGNNELQYYTNGNNASIQFDGSANSNVLVIEARQESGQGCWYGTCQYTSTRMISSGKKEFGYGRVEARIKMSQTQGGWPAFWMLGTNIGSVGWPACGEIDIMEHVNNEGQTHGTMHWQDHNGNYANYGGPVSNNVTGWHVYAVERDANEIRWYLDGNVYHIASIAGGVNGTSEFHNNFFLLLNFAVGGNWPGSPDGSSVFPQRMYVDYVRYYQ